MIRLRPAALLVCLPLTLAACGGGHEAGHDAPPPVAVAVASEAAGVHVTDPWIRAMPPGMSVAGGYFTLHNGGPEPLRLLRLSSPASPRVELHEMRTVDGMMQMRELSDGLLVDPGQQAVLAPGGLHLMLFDVAEPLQDGDRVSLTLHFETGEPMTVEVPVRRGPPGADAGHHGHH